MSDPDVVAADLEYSRVFDAPRELVFDCLITPEHLVHFWAPRGSSAPVAHMRVDPRPGGVFETVIVSDSDGSVYETHSVFLEIDRPERLVWQEGHTGMTVFVTLTALSQGKTRLDLRQTNVPAVVRLPRNRAGFKTTLDKFAAYLLNLSKEEQL
ncbi:SRPBCC domain-containing protein [Arthrobacter sp. ISL-95]|uniref:SRPBCC family protein n=1 Tax=Arthrobacter sp. ISL-95 TaxID=2819116 RepID=UPI001BEBB007|nr:SRPBCC domain-containing protein [Arthrobacter sp. ISL-95]MBT2587659.1 SRPBCC domain-containing protein [Arthrobacter sp. ISL-95]